MRRAFMGLAVAVFTVLAFAGPASAAPGQVTIVRIHSTSAYAEWFSNNTTDTAPTRTEIIAQSSELEVFISTENFDLNGNVLGFTVTSVDLPQGSSGFTFTIDLPKLASASVSGSGLPTTVCTYDANANFIGCTPGPSIDVNVTWTEQGPLQRGVINEHTKFDGGSTHYHANGTTNFNGNATGTIGDATFTAVGNNGAILGNDKTGSITLCVGNSCG